MLRRMALGYFGGAVGAVISSLALWAAGQAGLGAMLEIHLAPDLTWAWISPRILWGGIFGLGYPLVLRLHRSPTRAGLLLSLIPTGAALYFLPRATRGLVGVSGGDPMVPIVVVVANALWGFVLARTVIVVR